jgi:hypothetical protein
VITPINPEDLLNPWLGADCTGESPSKQLNKDLEPPIGMDRISNTKSPDGDVIEKTTAPGGTIKEITKGKDQKITSASITHPNKS